MNNKLLKLALDAHLLNYVEHETPRHYFIDGYADTETVQDFAELIIQECMRVCTCENPDPRDSIELQCSNRIKEHFGIE